MAKARPSPDIRAYRVQDFCIAFGIGRTKVYEMIDSGKLRTVLVGGRRVIPRDAAEALLNEGAPKGASLRPHIKKGQQLRPTSL